MMDVLLLLLVILVPAITLGAFVGLILRRYLNNKGQQGQQRQLGPTELLDPERLQIIHRSGGWYSPRREIYRDEHTGVQYLVIGTAITPLLDQDGKPLTR